MTPLGVILGAGIGAGILILITQFTRPGTAKRTVPVASPTRPALFAGLRPRALTRKDGLFAAAGVGVGLVLAIQGGWIIAILVLPVAAVGMPRLLANPDSGAIDQLEGLEEWTRALRGTLGSDAMLATAITRTLVSTPPAIRPAVSTLVDRLRATVPIREALYAFADDLDSATGDFVAASLIQASKSRGPGLQEVLDAIADGVAREVRMRRTVETERLSVLRQTRMVIAIIVPTVIVFVFASPFGAAYSGPLGQLVLAAVAALFVADLAWLQAKAKSAPAARFLTHPERLEEGTRA